MELLKKDSFLEFTPDTLQYLRRQYDLDKPGRIDEAINLLEEWIKKQPHFARKDFSREYLERTLIIFSKGSVEKAKVKLDKLCTFRTLYPDFFGVHEMKKLDLIQNIEANIIETMKVLNPVELKNAFTVVKEGYGMRIKEIHVLSYSKAIEVYTNLLKQLLSDKLSSRIMVHKTNESIYEYIPREILPRDYNGDDMSLLELHTRFQRFLTSKEFSDYLIEMNKARTNEKLRIKTDEDEDLGIPGSFDSL